MPALIRKNLILLEYIEGAPITDRSRRWGISEDFPEDVVSGIGLEKKEESAK